MSLIEPLDNARSRDVKRRKDLILGSSAVIALCGVFIVGASLLDFSRKPVPAPESESAVRIEETRIEKTPLEEARGKETRAGKKPEPGPVVTGEEARAQFKKRIGKYENETAPLLAAANLDAWNRKAAAEIEGLEREAMERFQAEDYSGALARVQELEQKADAVLAEKGRAFREALENARAALDDWRYDDARRQVERALSIEPESTEALILQKRIAALPDVLPLLERAKIAQVENNPEKERDLLRQVLQAVPDHEATVRRVATLSRTLDDRAFAQHISDAYASLEKGKVRAARRAYEAAKGIYPAREDLSLLSAKLQASERSVRIRSALRNAKKAVREDNWRKARDHFLVAKKYLPNDARVVEGLARARKILSLRKALSQYAADPYRLGNGNVQAQAEKTLAQANAASQHSRALGRQAREVATLIRKMNTKVRMTVISDNRTYVRVRGVGKVGVVSRKEIRIKPGRYTFEGVRDGFHSKLIKVTVPYDRTGFSVKVICDDPI
uniref:Tetratricopeptide repeat-containing protein n=1 Tax=Candidatus Kentrum sp. MB TaxID=2138164 RepID=A0A451BD13_9GAMM|nr:MAG: hypothetical protein BECKMB1821I_GA0114274_102811 [Candidatus Kentron sp. MB]VFK76171.1 MAG: hypothetical protein BECKMB1821H_GA0114242_10453 [Candidatus Kentron sp. MB]